MQQLQYGKQPRCKTQSIFGDSHARQAKGSPHQAEPAVSRSLLRIETHSVLRAGYLAKTHFGRDFLQNLFYSNCLCLNCFCFSCECPEMSVTHKFFITKSLISFDHFQSNAPSQIPKRKQTPRLEHLEWQAHLWWQPGLTSNGSFSSF